MRDLDGKDLCGSLMEVLTVNKSCKIYLHKIINSCQQVSLAKPPSDKKKKEEILRARERRMMQMMQSRSGILG